MRKQFIDYVLDFYGINGIYVEFFEGGMTRDEATKALDVRLFMRPDVEFNGDSLDRELVRDYVLAHRSKEG